MEDPFNLVRFVDAQASCWSQVVSELRAGRKRSHWMWFIFPQLRGLGSSPMARRYAIASRDEARAYLAHSLLGPRLIEASRLAAAAERDVAAVFGSLDAMKLRSSATLFAAAADDPSPFRAVLERCFDGEADPRTLALLGTD